DGEGQRTQDQTPPTPPPGWLPRTLGHERWPARGRVRPGWNLMPERRRRQCRLGRTGLLLGTGGGAAGCDTGRDVQLRVVDPPPDEGVAGWPVNAVAVAVVSSPAVLNRSPGFLAIARA